MAGSGSYIVRLSVRDLHGPTVILADLRLNLHQEKAGVKAKKS